MRPQMPPWSNASCQCSEDPTATHAALMSRLRFYRHPFTPSGRMLINESGPRKCGRSSFHLGQVRSQCQIRKGRIVLSQDLEPALLLARRSPMWPYEEIAAAFRVKHVMTPWEQVLAISGDLLGHQAAEVLQSKGFDFAPCTVVGEIVGIVERQVLAAAEPSEFCRSLSRPLR